MTRRSWLKRRGWGLAAGVAATLLTCLAYRIGWLQRVDHFSYDLHCRYLSSVQAHPSIVLIDIDDNALYRIERWPWGRSTLAKLVRTLGELNARAILLDMTFPEPQRPGIDHPAWGKDHDVDVPVETLGDGSIEDIKILHDQELAAAIAQVGCVFVGMHGRLWHRLPAGEITGWKPVPHEAWLPDAKRWAARRLARRFLDDNPNATWPDFHATALPGRRFDDLSADREDLLRAFRAVGAIRTLLPRWPRVPDVLTGRLERIYDLSPPILPIAEAARGVGSVVFNPADTGGVVRDVPLLLDYGGRLIPHVALAVAADLLDIDLSQTELEDDTLIFRDRQGSQTWRMQIDARGQSPLSWHLPAAQKGLSAQPVDPLRADWLGSFEPHIPVTRVMKIVATKDAILHNERYMGLRLARLVELQFLETPGEYERYARQVRQRNRARSKNPLPYGRGSGIGGRGSDIGAAELEARIDRFEAQAIDWFRYMRTICEDDSTTEGEQDPQCAEIAALLPYLSEEARANHRRQQTALAAEADVLADDLRPRIDGKVCLVGFTATSVADFIATPVFAHVPGVIADANIINAFLQNRFVRRASAGANLSLIAFAGLVLTILASLRGPWFGVGSLLAVWAVLSGASATAFHTNDYWIASVTACLASALAWAAVTVARQLTEERLRRQIINVLGQYTSPTIAARVADEAAGDSFQPRRACVTCFFCDLRDFTSLAERVGPERTRQILNPYLSMISDRLIAADALVNKFLGDGVMAFFNAPILPRPDHALRGCRAAIQCLDAMERLNAMTSVRDSLLTPTVETEFSTERAAEAGVKLELKIGIATGEVAVGDFGTEAKKDYTCIGDAVNLASRFESANALFGTQIIADDATRRAATDAFAWRPLGLIRVVGKKRAVQAYTMLGAAADVDEADMAYARAFEAALRPFQACQWPEAVAEFNACLVARPGDKAALLYLRRIEALRESPPPQDWDGALELPFK